MLLFVYVPYVGYADRRAQHHGCGHISIFAYRTGCLHSRNLAETKNGSGILLLDCGAVSDRSSAMILDMEVKSENSISLILRKEDGTNARGDEHHGGG